MEAVWKGLRYKDAANAVFYHGDCTFDAASTLRVIGVKMRLDSWTIVSCSSSQAAVRGDNIKSKSALTMYLDSRYNKKEL